MTAYPHLGFDPVASDEGSGASIAYQLRRTASRLDEMIGLLEGKDGTWQGRSAEAFRASVDDELLPRAREARESFSLAARAVDGWVGDVPGFRRRAQLLEDEAAAAASQAVAAQQRLDGLVAPAEDAPEREQFDRDRRAAERAVSAAQGDISRILEDARRLQDDVEARGAEVATSLTTAMNIAPDKPGLFASLADFDIGEWLSDAADWFMDDFLPALQELARVVGAVATIAAFVCTILTPFFPALAALAGAFALIGRIAGLVDLAVSGINMLAGKEGAFGEFLVGAVSTVVGAKIGSMVGPIVEANLNMGALVPVIAGVGSSGTATLAFQVNQNFLPSAVYWGITNFRDVSGAVDELDPRREEAR
ncbi:hypothetical protein D9V41_10750 [Aeromicrobium phragmitis]|uniref:WXG100 family type VII secretion target n=1 Tax=Aeromicrobium phragmitis TaxID=2478914 RepID=A0A3L8PL95_9ACTN|nr:hypothetical protein [Aeromicrobium phragmitis]RLV55559.1 hypothetical protein D9V41_10750 [Aeromicrobium phragmitis]